MNRSLRWEFHKEFSFKKFKGRYRAGLPGEREMDNIETYLNGMASEGVEWIDLA
jgi:hypothetical protein